MAATLISILSVHLDFKNMFMLAIFKVYVSYKFTRIQQQYTAFWVVFDEASNRNMFCHDMLFLFSPSSTINKLTCFYGWN